MKRVKKTATRLDESRVAYESPLSPRGEPVSTPLKNTQERGKHPVSCRAGA